MILYFNIKELCITPETIPQHVADKLYRYHILPMNKVRMALGKPIHCKDSRGHQSGYRPLMWELSRGRSGNSQHVFRGWGAIDWRTNDPDDLDQLWNLMLELTGYTRLARYDNFIHADYKAADGKRYLFKSNAASQWDLTDVVPL